MRDYAYSDLCTQTLNQLSVGIVFTKNGIIQFMNTQMSVWLNQNVQFSNNLTFSDIFHHQDTLLRALKKSQELLNQTKCCCYTIQKSLFLKKLFFKEAVPGAKTLVTASYLSFGFASYLILQSTSLHCLPQMAPPILGMIEYFALSVC